MKKLLILALAAGMAFTGLASCSSSGGKKDGSYKPFFVYAIGSDQDIMDPQYNRTNDKVLRMVYSSLIVRTAAGEFEGELAESWQVAEDGVTWTFKLKPGIQFHDGTPCDAYAVKASYDRLLDKTNPTNYTETNAFILDTAVVDELTFQIITDGPTGAFYANIASPSHLILNPVYIQKYGNNLGTSADSISGTGPYKITSWKRDEGMDFEAFDGYFGQAPKTKNFALIIIAEDNARTIAVETEQVDIADRIPAADADRLKSDPKIQVINVASNGQHLFQFNCASPKMTLETRQAISYAIDRKAIVSALYPDDVPSTAPLSPQTWGYYNFGTIERDLEKSKELLKTAGYEDGLDIKIMVTAVYLNGVQMGEMIREQLKEAGINATLETIERATFLETMNSLTPAQYNDKFGYDMFIMGAGPSSLDAEGGLKRIWMTSATGTNENNYGFYSNEQVDELILKGGQEVDQVKRAEYYKEAMQILYIDDPCGVWMNDRHNTFVMSANVEGFSAGTTGVISFDRIQVLE